MNFVFWQVAGEGEGEGIGWSPRGGYYMRSGRIGSNMYVENRILFVSKGFNQIVEHSLFDHSANCKAVGMRM